MNIQINLDPSDAEEVLAAQALLAKLAGDAPVAEEPEAEEKPKSKKKVEEPEEDDAEAADADAAEEPDAEEEKPKSKKQQKQAEEDDEAADKSAELKVLAKKLIAKDRAAMAKILKKFDAEGLSAIPPFKIEKAIAMIEEALEA